MIDLNPEISMVANASAQRSFKQDTAVDFTKTFDSKMVKREEIEDAAAQLISTAFIQPLLAQMRNDPFKVDMFHGGRGEEIFGQQLDTLLSERVTASANFPMVDAIVNQFLPTQPKGSEVDRRG